MICIGDGDVNVNRGGSAPEIGIAPLTQIAGIFYFYGLLILCAHTEHGQGRIFEIASVVTENTWPWLGDKPGSEPTLQLWA